MKFKAGHNRILNQGGSHSRSHFSLLFLSLSHTIVYSLALVTCWADALDSHPHQSLSFCVPVCLATSQPPTLMRPVLVLCPY